jgi:hypothetical protein
MDEWMGGLMAKWCHLYEGYSRLPRVHTLGL